MDPSKNPMRKIPLHKVRSSLGGLGREEERQSIASVFGKQDDQASNEYRRPTQLIDFSKLITVPAKLINNAVDLSQDLMLAVRNSLGYRADAGNQHSPSVSTGPREIHTIKEKKLGESV